MKRILVFLCLIPIVFTGCMPADTEDSGGVIETTLPEKFLGAAADLAEFLNVKVDDIKVLSIEPSEFSNGCLDLDNPDRLCAQVITPGFKVTFETPNGTYLYHVNEEGSQFGLAQAGDSVEPAHVENPVVVWERSGGFAGICQQLMVYSDAAYVLIDCVSQDTISQGILAEEEMGFIRGLQTKYGTVEWKFNPPAGSADMFLDQYTLFGSGEEIPEQKIQEEINQFLSELVSKL